MNEIRFTTFHIRDCPHCNSKIKDKLIGNGPWKYNCSSCNGTWNVSVKQGDLIASNFSRGLEKPDWKDSENPPETTEGYWSDPVVVHTNYGNTFKISYFGSKEEGCWQRPAKMEKGEKVEYWIKAPEFKK